ncbi:uncharacterized protein [Eleutherodactylus coqui]|uniref:uncharacterized protein isoform X2 n=1 Tax=Eleutherodactylus coqui TaxID=57060 RepID=UPI00346182A7
MSVPVSFHLWLLRMRRGRRHRHDQTTYLEDRHRDFWKVYQQLRRRRKLRSTVNLSEEKFDALLSKTRRYLERIDAHQRERVSAEEMLLLTLRYLAKGTSYSTLHLQFALSNSTITQIVKNTCRILWDVLQPEQLPHPTADDWLDIAEGFEEVTQFPNCVGVVEAKHFRCLQHLGYGFSYHDYEDYQSVVMMAIVDTNYRFLAVDFETFYQGYDSKIFEASNMGKRLYEGQFGLPPPRPLPGTQEPVLPFVLVGSKAFKMGPNLLKPYSDHNLDDAKREFNLQLNKARVFAEGAFLILIVDWKVLTKSSYASAEDMQLIIKACVVLHNLILPREILFQIPLESDLPSVSDPGPRATNAVMKIRDQFAEYFSCPEERVP